MEEVWEVLVVKEGWKKSSRAERIWVERWKRPLCRNWLVKPRIPSACIQFSWKWKKWIIHRKYVWKSQVKQTQESWVCSKYSAAYIFFKFLIAFNNYINPHFCVTSLSINIKTHTHTHKRHIVFFHPYYWLSSLFPSFCHFPKNLPSIFINFL